MKTNNFVYLALVGLIDVNAIRFRPNAFQQPWSAPEPAGPKGIVATGYNPEDNGAVFYERVLPE